MMGLQRRIKDREMDEDNKPYTMSVPAAGKKYFGLGRNASYEAAKRGDLPTMKVGSLLRVLVRPLERKLDEGTA
jgi:hypothetical protein